MPARSVTVPALKGLTSRTSVNAKVQFPVEGLSKECFGNIFILLYFGNIFRGSCSCLDPLGKLPSSF